jgi:hypothetical protein
MECSPERTKCLLTLNFIIMKKEIKFKKWQLSLNKETLSQINDQQMKAIAGGVARAASTNVTNPPTGTKAEQIVAASDCCSTANTACCGS